MKTKNKNLASTPFHPLLLGIYPVLALYSFNANEIAFSGIWQALITACVFVLVMLATYLLIFRSWERASIFTSWISLLFFSYGHIFDVVGSANESWARHRYFIPVFVIIFLAGSIYFYRYSNLKKTTKFFKTMSVLLMISVSIQLTMYVVQMKLAARSHSETSVAQPSVLSSSSDRDVYYILVDAFGRQDLLGNAYYLDLSSFISQLTQLGFYIPDCTQSNYDNTRQSLTSSLNMQYLDALGLDFADEKELFIPFLQHSQVRMQFERLGYDTVTFKSLYPYLDIQDSTYYFDYFENEKGLTSLNSLNFQYLFLRTTALRPLVELLEAKPDLQISSFLASWIPVNNTLTSRDYRQYQQNVFALNTLESLPDLPGKKFVYAHLYVTHQPFVFYPDGSFHPSLPQDANAYRDQVIFASKRLLEIVKVILEKSKNPPVIIIQGDHSNSKLADRVEILNAYYLPNGGEKNLYPTISPVNTFRVVFNTYFNGNYQMLPDIARYSDKAKKLHEVSSTCVNGINP